MKSFRIGFCVCLLLCSFLLLIPTQAHANQLDEGQCGDNLHWKYEAGTLTISGTGEMWIFHTGQNPWESFQNSVERVILEDGVTSISIEAFRFFENLKDVQIPDSVVDIGIGAFSECTALTNITLPSGITQISGGLFYGCVNLHAIVIPDGVTNIDAQAFFGCSSLEYIAIPASVKEIAYNAFQDCTGLWHILFGGRKGQWDNLMPPVHSESKQNLAILKDVDIHYGTKWNDQIDPANDVCKICRGNRILLASLCAAVAVGVTVAVVVTVRRRNRLF